MQIKFFVTGTGFSIKGVGVDVFKGAVILLRDQPGDGVVSLYMVDPVGVGKGNTVLGATGIKTDWIPLNLSKHEWLLDTRELVGREAALRISGGAFFADGARFSIKFSVYDKHLQTWNEYKADNAQGPGGNLSFGDIVVRSKLGRQTDGMRLVKNDDGTYYPERLVEALE